MARALVAGGGPAGMIAAIAAADAGHKVTIIEKNDRLGKKLSITGKGRCNLTNACDAEELIDHVMSNPRFLYSALYSFDNQSVISFFEENGVPTKVERGNRVFPASDRAADVVAALRRALKRRGVEVMLRSRVADLLIEEDAPGGDAASGGTAPDGIALGGSAGSSGDAAQGSESRRPRAKGGKPSRRVCGVRLSSGEELFADAVILATGGCSYPACGSTGDGYRLAGEAGHSVVEPSPSLVPFIAEEQYVRRLSGLSLRNVRVRIMEGRSGGEPLYEAFGEMLFTHFGVSGPLILSASAAIPPDLVRGRLFMEVDLKPALDAERLDARIQRDLGESGGRQFKNSLGALFPAKLIPVMVELSGIPPEKRCGAITRDERERLSRLTKAFPVTLCGTRGFDEAVVTRGGVCVREVDPYTMESRLAAGLYICGELLDLDAATGGYNLQIAWSTGHLAGSSIL